MVTKRRLQNTKIMTKKEAQTKGNDIKFSPTPKFPLPYNFNKSFLVHFPYASFISVLYLVPEKIRRKTNIHVMRRLNKWNGESAGPL